MKVKRIMEREDFEAVSEHVFQMSATRFALNGEISPVILVINMRSDHSVKEVTITSVTRFFGESLDVLGKESLARTMHELAELADFAVLVTEVWMAKLREPKVPPGIETVADMDNAYVAVMTIMHSADQCHAVTFPIDHMNNTLLRGEIDFSARLSGRFAKDRTVQ